MNRRTQNIHERFLRHIWSKQYLTTALQTSEGKTIKVFDVGQLNTGGGPDFLQAKIQIDGVVYVGDVEIHRTSFDWLQHQHQADPRYNKVILHVVLEASSAHPPTIVCSGRIIPVLVLGRFLSDTIQTIWQKAILDERSKKFHTIPCFDKNTILTPDALEHWLVKLALERLELKLRRFDERLKQLAHERRMTLREWQRPYGALPLEGEHNEIPMPFKELTQKDFSTKDLWEQLLYEGVMEGLGYSKNREPFLRLAENMTLHILSGLIAPHSDDMIESLMFGAANLLPKSETIQEKESRRYVYRLRKSWKSLRPQYHGEILHPADWQFFPTRPSNFPTIRLAAASVLVKKFMSEDIFRRTIQTLKSSASASAKEKLLIELFHIETNGFWQHHFNFQNTAPVPVTALGISRIRDITMNAVLPIALLYARIFKDKDVREGVLDVYQSIPSYENNSITRLMEKQLLKKRAAVKNVIRQQGVIQLYKYYCSEERCSECELGFMIARSTQGSHLP
jgi:hypothetical protein